ncbi:MAG: hypothetical protein ACTS3F_00130 [Phycisphaerales bacterium]
MVFDPLSDADLDLLVRRAVDDLDADGRAALERRLAHEPGLARAARLVDAAAAGIRGLCAEVRTVRERVMAAAEGVLRANRGLPAGFDGDVVSALAELALDTRSGELIGMRGIAEAYQLVFVVDGVEVHLNIGAVDPGDEVGGGVGDGGDVMLVRGQADLPSDRFPAWVHASPLAGPGTEARGELDETGYFTLRLAAGVYRVVIVSAGGGSIVLDGVEVG